MNQNISSIKEGFPEDNVILIGIKSLEDFGSIDDNLLKRDLEINNSEKFLSCAWEALFWLKDDAEDYANSLSDQMFEAWKFTSREKKVYILSGFIKKEDANIHQKRFLFKLLNIDCKSLN